MDLTKLGYRKDYDPNNRVVKSENVGLAEKTLFVSTVDLGLDHSFGDGPELYYETMIFQRMEDGNIDYHDLYCRRYTTRETALEEHEKLITDIKAGKYTLDEDYYLSVVGEKND